MRQIPSPKLAFNPSQANPMCYSERFLSNAFFLFGDQCYQQISGTAMGTRLTVTYANIYMSVVLAAFFQAQPPAPFED